MSVRRVFGVDPGLAVTGFGVIDGDGTTARLVVCGVLRTRAHDPRPVRLADLFTRAGALLDELEPAELAMEQHYVATNVRSAMTLGEARAAVLVAAAVRGVPTFEYPASTIKHTVAGYGAAPKEQVQAMVTMHLGLAEPPTPLDASDALAVALTRLATGRFELLLAREGGR
ncbi:MAG: crossover junction endodeoxyribonuclease RuvC [Dehalococcoidia bacterium]|nr:crossover junction endodeoxyribonuclease RuvC [Dehalococcoidia bacterium]